MLRKEMEGIWLTNQVIGSLYQNRKYCVFVFLTEQSMTACHLTPNSAGWIVGANNNYPFLTKHWPQTTGLNIHHILIQNSSHECIYSLNKNMWAPARFHMLREHKVDRHVRAGEWLIRRTLTARHIVVCSQLFSSSQGAIIPQAAPAVWRVLWLGSGLARSSLCFVIPECSVDTESEDGKLQLGHLMLAWVAAAQ